MVGRCVSRLLALVAFLTLAGNAFAQGGAVAGKVTDESGRAIVAARVQAISGGATVATVATNDAGTYRIGGLAAGTYTIVASRIGFAAKRTVGVSVTASGTATADFALAELASQLNQVVTTATRGASQEKILDAPASISVVSSERIASKPATSVGDYMRTQPGLSVSSGGIVQNNIVSRGFNNAFSGAMLMLQDYRFAGVPSLRVNVPFLFTGTNDDIDRIEVLNGPASALFGPNSANGVLHIITKSPFRSKGTSLSIDGGSQSILRGTLRHAGTFGADKWGYKFSGEYFTGTDWKYTDPNEPATWVAGPNVPTARVGQAAKRDFSVRRYSGEARLDYKPNDDFENVFSTGLAHIVSAIELTTTFGAVQAKNWEYKNFQDRFRYKKFFAQVFYNDNNSGNANKNDLDGTFYLRTGIPVVDKSTVTSAQVQQGFSVGKSSFVAGVDYILTKPRSEGTIFGKNEGSTDITELGAYLQNTLPLASRLDLVTAFRGDQTNRLEGSQFSPRAALIFKASATNNFRFTYSRAFNSPASFNYFLDQLQVVNKAPLFNVQVVGNPPKQGWVYNRGCTSTVNAGLCMHSPFVLSGPKTAVASSAGSAWLGFLQAMPQIIPGLPIPAASKQGLLGLIQAFGPNFAQINPAQLGTVLRDFLNTGATLAPADVKDLDQLRASFSTTWEVGYKGIIGDRLRVAIDYWYQIRPGEAPNVIVNSGVFFNPATLGASLAGAMVPALMAQGMPQAQAVATATAYATSLTTVMAALPVGSLAMTNTLLNPDQHLIYTYRNPQGTIDVRGVDLAVDFQANDNWILAATYSNLGKNVFPESGGSLNPMMANAPKHRGSASARFQNASWTTDATVRYADAFPVNSGLLNSLGIPPNAAGYFLYPPVPSQTQVDLGFSWKLPLAGQNVTWATNVTNLLDNQAPTFVGTPNIGRLLMTRLKYDF